MAKNDCFLRACRREPVPYTPVWFMRQAGRYQAEYRAIREKYSLLEICREPELAAEVTLLPIKQLGVDAAILFSDIMVPLGGMGVDFEIRESVGPMVNPPIRSLAQVEALRPLEPEEGVPFVLEAIRILRRELPVPLIGFSGAPFTLASYLVEGRPSRNYLYTKQMMYGAPEVWSALMERLAGMVVTYLKAQVAAGAEAVQVFDSWVGALAPQDYQTYVLPHMKRLFAGLKDLGVPIIHFGVGTGMLLELLREAGGDVIGLDWRVPLDQGWQRIGYDRGVQGNLDSTLLFAPEPLLESRIREILAQAGGRPGHIFNLGHGVLPETNPDTLRRVVEIVHTASSR